MSNVDNEIRTCIERDISDAEFKITCPKCGAVISVHDGINKCSKCGETINVTVELDLT